MALSGKTGLAPLGHLGVVVYGVHRGPVTLGRALLGLLVLVLVVLLLLLLLLLHVDVGGDARNLHVAHAKVVNGLEAVGGGHHGGRHASRDVAGDVVVGRRGRAGDVGADVGGDVGGPAVDVAAGHGNVVLAVVWQRVVVGRGGEGRHSRRGDGARGAGGVVLLVVGGRGRVGRRGHGHAHGLAQAAELVLEGLVAAQEVLQRAVAVLVAAQLLELALQAINVLLGAGADGALGLAVVGALAGELGRREGRDAAGAWRRETLLAGWYVGEAEEVGWHDIPLRLEDLEAEGSDETGCPIVVVEGIIRGVCVCVCVCVCAWLARS